MPVQGRQKAVYAGQNTGQFCAVFTLESRVVCGAAPRVQYAMGTQSTEACT